ncbi:MULTISPECIES: hypothetical protein [Gordonia]|uniref:hypothetical protein n=1 Tax=Gordonia TaxID=2053 RepID=UPI0007EB3ABF|nr:MULTISPECIES: hypothetical protein [unclassified Gordonia (in: high G+C Gram-positive bacteria)]OBC11826.1 hypothetical protein A5786_03265 [Gordonia sp. 852002-50816_SCH5313054-a]OBC21620.1 hypothetical protein A5788_04065 [Gordonia sp. 852002-50816_SCH5313054-c]
MTEAKRTEQKPPAKAVEVTGGLLDKAQRLQAPAVKKYVDALRKAHPDESPEQIIRRLEKQFLRTVMGTGSAVGATAAIPGVGTMTALTAMTGETALFLEASALFALAVAEVHGIGVEQSERRKTLVLAVALGEEGVAALGRLIGTRGGALRRLGTAAIPGGGLGKLNTTLMNKIVKKYAIKRAPLIFGKLMPAGIGAVVGGAGNRALGRRVVVNAREAFGPAPKSWHGDVVDGSVVTEPGLPAGDR